MIEMEEVVEDDTAVGFCNKDRHHFLPDAEVIQFNSNTNFATSADYFGLSCFAV